MIDPTWLESESLGRCNRATRLLFFGLVSLSDDYGKCRGNSKFLKSTVFAYDEDILLDDINEWLRRLAEEKSIIQYQADGKYYIKLVNWERYQKISKPTPSKIPDIPRETQGNPEKPTDSPPNRIEENRIEENRILGDVGKKPTSKKEKLSTSDKILYNSIKDSFESKYGDFEDYPKEGSAIKGLIKKAKHRATDFPDIFIKSMIEAFWKLKEGGNKFWKGQPFLASVLNSAGIWPRVLETQRTEKEFNPTDTDMEGVTF